MRYCEFDQNGYIIGVGIGMGGKAITKNRYIMIRDMIRTKPPRTETTAYRLLVTLEWEAYEAEPEEEPEPSAEDKAEGYDILVGMG